VRPAYAHHPPTALPRIRCGPRTPAAPGRAPLWRPPGRLRPPGSRAEPRPRRAPDGDGRSRKRRARRRGCSTRPRAGSGVGRPAAVPGVRFLPGRARPASGRRAGRGSGGRAGLSSRAPDQGGRAAGPAAPPLGMGPAMP